MTTEADRCAYRCIPGFGNYEIALDGTVRNAKTGRVISLQGKRGNAVQIRQDGRYHYKSVAELLLRAWGRTGGAVLDARAAVSEVVSDDPEEAEEGEGQGGGLAARLASAEARVRVLEAENAELRATLAACGVF